MRQFLIEIALLAVTGLLFAACSQDPASAATGTGGTGGTPTCEGVYIVDGDKDGGEPCDICLHDNCCNELAFCRDKACIACVNNFDPQSCGAKPKAVNNCLELHCDSTCNPKPPFTTSSGSDVTTTTSGS